MGSRIALLHLDDAAVGCILFLDELFQLFQQLYLIPCIACRQHQIEQHVGGGPPRHEAQTGQLTGGVEGAQLLGPAGAQHAHGSIRGNDGVVVDGNQKPVIL